MRNVRITALVLVLCLAAAACEPATETPAGVTPAVATASGPTESEAVAEQIAQGRRIAEQECSECHALDDAATSPRPDAPPMRDLLARYDADILADDLIAGIKMGHEDMPLFDFNVIAADALVAYLRSIRPPPGGGHE